MAQPPSPPPKPPKQPKAAASPPAPRRSARKGATAKSATTRAPATKPDKALQAPPVTEPASATAATARKSSSARKPAARTSTARAAPKSATRTSPIRAAAKPAASRSKSDFAKLAARPTATVKKAVAALPPVGRTAAWSLGAVALAAGAGLAAFLTRGRIATLLRRGEGHVPRDLLYPDRDGQVKTGDDRATTDFRPDMGAAMTAAEREALRPPPGTPV